MFMTISVTSEAKEYDLTNDINNVLEYLEQHYDADGTHPLLEMMSSDVLTPVADWAAFCAALSGEAESREVYLNALSDKISELYKTDSLLDRNRATEWHRTIFAITALGGDPYSFSSNKNGKPINLIADGIYNRGKIASLGKQGLIGWIYGLLTAASLDVDFPEDAYYNYSDLVNEITSKQLADGGFKMSGNSADADVTAMAVQALALYDNRQGEKTLTQNIKNAINCLSDLQNDDGSFSSLGEPTAESTAQVIIALCISEINPSVDERFIKNGNSAIDALLSFRQDDGGFSHIQTGNSDGLATVQSMLALLSCQKFIEKKATIFDLSITETSNVESLNESYITESKTANTSDIDESRIENQSITTQLVITFAVIMIIAAAVIIISNRFRRSDKNQTKKEKTR